MFNDALIVVMLFLVAMALLAGGGIGLLIGLALGARDRLPAKGAAPVWSAPEVVSQTPAAATTPRNDVGHTLSGPHDRVGVAGGGRATAWSVALAFAVIIVCCACTFLMAVFVTLGQ